MYEIILNDEFLMSSLFTTGEIALAERALAAVDGDALHVIVGGLGLGYTAAAVLDDPRVERLTVIEALEPVVEWHRDGLLPMSARLTRDSRTTLHAGDFFAAARDGFPAHRTGTPVDAVIVDIDHSPRHWLASGHGAFYTETGIHAMVTAIRPSGVFALWSNDPADDAFVALLQHEFATVESIRVSVGNPLTGVAGSNTVYVAQR